jgi:protein-S-isoprenylcysteine O-methyltransferase Ste14
MHRLLVYTWPYALVFWSVMIWTFAPEVRVIRGRPEESGSPDDAHSKQLIVIGQGLGVFGAFASAIAVPSAGLVHRARWFWIGVALLIAGGLLRRHCRRILGSSFTGAVIVRPDQVVAERGAYRYVRHPSYTAGALLFLGMGLALANWLSVLVLAAAVVIAYGYRVGVEERALAATIGEPYRAYMGRTKRFVPFLF